MHFYTEVVEQDNLIYYLQKEYKKFETFYALLLNNKYNIYETFTTITFYDKSYINSRITLLNYLEMFHYAVFW